MKLADAIAGIYDQGAFLIDVAVSGDGEAVELLVAALNELEDEECCLAVLDAIVEADRREDDEAMFAASRLFHAVRER